MNENKMVKEIYRANLEDNTKTGRLWKTISNQIENIFKKVEMFSEGTIKACVKRLIIVSEARELCQSIISAYLNRNPKARGYITYINFARKGFSISYYSTKSLAKPRLCAKITLSYKNVYIALMHLTLL